MRTFFLCLMLVAIAPNSQGQIFKIDEQGLELFELGTKYLQSGEYNSADSILSLALCTYQNENVYFNRGISRLYRMDTIGFCYDLEFAAYKYFDLASEKLFHQLCCTKVDTLYFDKKMEPCSKNAYRYYEVYQEFKYMDKKIGKIHDIKNYEFFPTIDINCNKEIIDVKSIQSDIIGLYEKVDSNKYFYFSNKAPVISSFYKEKYNKFKTDLALLLDSKYQDLKVDNNINELSIIFTTYISEKGKILSIKYLYSRPEINIDDDVKIKIENDIMSSTINFPKMEPGSFLYKRVKYKLLDFVKF